MTAAAGDGHGLPGAASAATDAPPATDAPAAARRAGPAVAVGPAAALVALWLFLWGDASVANVASGVVVAVVLIVVFPQARSGGDGPFVVRPWALLRFVGYFAYELCYSNLLIAREIVSRRSHIRTGVIACPLRQGSDGIVTLLANVLALSPGTMMVEVLDAPTGPRTPSSTGAGAEGGEPEGAPPPTLYVHALLLYDVERVRGDVARLEAFVIRAFGSNEALLALEREAAS